MSLSVSKLLWFKNGDPEKSRIFLFARREVANVNISGTNLHSGLEIGIDRVSYLFCYKQHVLLRNILSEVKMVIIDVISKVHRVYYIFQIKSQSYWDFW